MNRKRQIPINVKLGRERKNNMGKMLKVTVMAAVAIAVTLGATAAITHNIVQSYQTAEGSLTGTTVITDDSEFNTSATLSGAVTNGVLTVTLTRSQLRSLCLYSTDYLTVLVNSSSAPANTFLLSPNSPQIGIGTNALSLVADVSALYLTCTNTNGCTFSLRSVLHTTGSSGQAGYMPAPLPQ